MKKSLLLLIVMISAAIGCFSQKIYFCRNYPVKGDTTERNTTFNINPSGNVNIYILCYNGGRPMNVYSFTYKIDRLYGNVYSNWETKIVYTLPSSTFQAIPYTFSTVGDFRITLVIGGAEIAKEYVKINNSSNTVASSGSASSRGFLNSRGVLAGTSSGPSCSINGISASFPQNKGVTFLISNGDKSFGTNQAEVTIYKNGNSTYLSSTRYDINKDGNCGYITNYFNSKGVYEIRVSTVTTQLNQDSEEEEKYTFIGSITITIY